MDIIQDRGEKLGPASRPLKVALNPLTWYFTVDGFKSELSSRLGDVYRQVRATGFEAVTIEVVESMTVPEYAALLASSGLAPAPGYFQAPFSQPSEMQGILEAAQRVASQHAALGLDRLFIAEQFADPARLSCPAQGRDHDAARLDIIIENLRLTAQVMVKEGVTPCLHQHVGTLIETPEEVESVLAKIEPNLLLLGPDTGHLAWAGADPVDFVRRHSDRIGAVHLKDVHLDVARKGRDRGEDYWQIARRHVWTEPGQGDLQLEEVVAALHGFHGWFVIEVDIADQPTAFESATVSWHWCQEHLGG